MRVMGDLIGSTLSGRYRMVARIAGGGMGEVYRGHDLLLDRSVAVKILQPALAAEPELVDRFRLEARAAARLLHPNVVAVYDWGSEDERTYYMVMEYVPGTDLRDVLVGRGSLEPSHAAEVMADVCDALAAAHAEGLVHRDVKPENVLISKQGRVKVADFGIAVIAADSERTIPGGAVSGTLRYLSPEQARGEEATPSSDIWAAGAVLSECLTGRPPNQGSGPDLLRRRAEEAPPVPSQLVSSVPRALDEVVARACALDPRDRFDDASEMAHELRILRASVLPDLEPVATLLEYYSGDMQVPEVEPTAVPGRHARQRRRRALARKRILKLVALLAALALVIGGGALAVRAFLAPRMIDVPSLVQLNRREAIERLRELGLDAEVIGKKDKFESRGNVLDQTPLSGTLEEGSTVSLTVSTGPPKTTLPSLIGMTLEKARAIVEDEKRGLTLGRTTEEYSLKEEGTVIAYSPTKARVEWGSKVNLVLSKGPQPLDVPYVVGLPEDKAVTQLEEAGFAPLVAEAYSNDVAIGKVIATDPPAGGITSEGGEVRVVVSVGPEYEELQLPDVRGMTMDRARARLEAQGLRVRVVQVCTGGTIVNETEPISRSTVRENDRIALFVC